MSVKNEWIFRVDVSSYLRINFNKLIYIEYCIESLTKEESFLCETKGKQSAMGNGQKVISFVFVFHFEWMLFVKKIFKP